MLNRSRGCRVFSSDRVLLANLGEKDHMWQESNVIISSGFSRASEKKSEAPTRGVSPSPFARTVLAERTGGTRYLGVVCQRLQQAFAAVDAIPPHVSWRARGRKVEGEENVPALASFFNGAATADGGKTGNQAVVAAALLSAGVLGRSLLVLHGLLALRRAIVLTLGRGILSLRGAIALKMEND